MIGVLSSIKNGFAKTALQTRFLTITPLRSYKKVVVATEDNFTTVEAKIESNPESSDILCGDQHKTGQYCPLCPKVMPRIKYTDVLVLNQFLDKSGKILPTHVTGLCKSANNILRMNVGQAQTAGLIKRPPDHEDNFYKWNKNNIFFL